jgi:hypothetical protein
MWVTGVQTCALPISTIDTEFDIRAIEQLLIEISSSALRARVAQGLSIRYYTPLAVADYFHRSYREHTLVNQQVGHCELEPTSSHPAHHHTTDPGGQA